MKGKKENREEKEEKEGKEEGEEERREKEVEKEEKREKKKKERFKIKENERGQGKTFPRILLFNMRKKKKKRGEKKKRNFQIFAHTYRSLITFDLFIVYYCIFHLKW